jgi:ubiquinone biosynthesis protein UbiJ
MAGTPTSRIIQTIQAVETIQAQVADLIEALRRLTARVEALETASRAHDDR